MKLADIPRKYPEIFVELPLLQQAAALEESGYIVKLDTRLTEFSISELQQYEDIYSFSGFAARELRAVSRTITYRGGGVTLIIDC